MEKRNVVENGRTCCAKCGRVREGSGPVQNDWVCPRCKWKGGTKEASEELSVGAAAEKASSLHKVK